MPSMIRTLSIAAGANTPNIFTGSAFELTRSQSVVSFGVSQSATGMFALINVGADVVAEEFEPPILTRYTIIPDEFYANDVAEMGDRIVMAIRNPTAGALTARAIAIVTPTGR